MAGYARRARSHSGSRCYRKPHRFEALESRYLLACQAFVDDGTLFVIGDDAANVVEIVGTESGVQVNWVNCDAARSEPFAGVSVIRAELRDGNDQATIDNRNGLLNGIATQVFGQDGDDYAIISAGQGMEGLDAVFFLNGGEGEDRLQIITGAEAQRFDIGTGATRDTSEIKITDIARNLPIANISTVDVESLSAHGGAGMDTLNVIASPFAELTLDGGEDADTVAIQFGRLTGRVQVSDSGTMGVDKLKLLGTEFGEKFELFAKPQPSDGWIAKWEGPDLDAQGNDVAIESIEIAHEGFELAEVDAGDGDDDVRIDNRDGVFNKIAIEVFGEGGNDDFSFEVARASEGTGDPRVPTPGFAFEGGAGVDHFQITAGLEDHSIDIKPNVQSIQVEDLTIDVRETTTGVDWDFRTSVELLTIRAGGGNDTATIHGALIGTTIKVLGEEGDDSLTVDGTLLNAYDDITFPPDSAPTLIEATWDGGEGRDHFILDTTNVAELIEVLGVPDQEVPDPEIRATLLASQAVAFHGFVLRTEDITVHAGDGNNQFLIDNRNGLLGSSAVNIISKAGNDSGTLMLYDQDHAEIAVPEIRTAWPAKMDFGEGDDTLSLVAAGLEELFDIGPGGQRDTIEVSVSDKPTDTALVNIVAAGVELLNVEADDGNDEFQVVGPLPTAFTLFGQRGDDLYTYFEPSMGVHDPDLAMPIELNGGDGNDEFVVSFSSGEFTSGSEANVAELVVDGGEGEDRLHIITGADAQRFEIAPGIETGSFQIETTAGHAPGSPFDKMIVVKGFQVEITTVEAGDGDDQVRVRDPDALLGGIDWNIITSDGDDLIDVSAAIGAAAAWNIDAGAGSNTSRFKITNAELPGPQDRTLFNFNYVGGADRDVVDLDVDLVALHIEQNVNIATAGGDDVVNMKGDFSSEEAHHNVRIDTGDGNDTVSYDWLVHVDRQLISAIEILAGAGNDTSRFRISGPESARPQDRVFLNFNYFAGTGRDTADVEFANLTFAGESHLGVDFAADNLRDTLNLSLRDITIAKGAGLDIVTNLAGRDNDFTSMWDHLTNAGTIDWNVQIGPGKTRFKPLFAFYVADLDGKFNFNQHFTQGSGQTEFVLRDSIIAGDWNWNYHGGTDRHRLFAIIDRTTLRSNVFAVWTTVGFFDVDVRIADLDVSGVIDVSLQGGAPGSRLNIDAERVNVTGELRWRSDPYAETIVRAVDWLVSGIADLVFRGDDAANRYRLDLQTAVHGNGHLAIEVDGRGGNDHLAANLLFEAMADGMIDIALSGGEGNDLLSLLAFGQTDPQRPPRLLIDGGPGHDIATATPNVHVVNCEVVQGEQKRR